MVVKKKHASYPSVQFSHSVVFDSLWPPELQHARPPCPSPTPGVHPNLCPLSRWCHLTILSSVISFSSCSQSFPASGSFEMSQLSASGGQSIGVSASISVPPMNTQDWSPLVFYKMYKFPGLLDLGVLRFLHCFSHFLTSRWSLPSPYLDSISAY